MNRVRIAVAGAGAFGRNHLRVLHSAPAAELAGVVDTDSGRGRSAAAEFGCQLFPSLDSLAGKVDAAIVATPTSEHAAVGCALMEAGIDVLIEKPIASGRDSARRLVDTAAKTGRLLQVGHLERFNPAVSALKRRITIPLFFEVHRLSVFTTRSLDVDVVLDLMIHDVDIVLDLLGEQPEEIRAAGISILSSKVDIANVRLAFPGGCVANLTASRVSTERVRKLRVFQPHQYISLDYAGQKAVAFTVKGAQEIGFEPIEAPREEPLRLELESFLESVRTRKPPVVNGEDGYRALDVALNITAKIEEHSQLVAQRLRESQPSSALS